MDTDYSFSPYYACNSRVDYITVSTAVMSASHYVDNAFHMLADFTERYLYQSDLSTLADTIQCNPDFVSAFLYACSEQIRAAKLDLDVFVDPNSPSLRCELKLNEERQRLINAFNGGKSNDDR